MSLFSLFSSSKPAPVADGSATASGPVPEPYVAVDNATQRKAERLERRELLYAVVRECMTRAGMLSASYRFKVLSLDARGREYLIMMDLMQQALGDPGRLTGIETSIAQGAKTTHGIVVTAVYWRSQDMAGAGYVHKSPAAVAPAPPKPPLPRRAGASTPVPVDFQDTEVVSTEVRVSPLSVTQYGDLP